MGDHRQRKDRLQGGRTDAAPAIEEMKHFICRALELIEEICENMPRDPAAGRDRHKPARQRHYVPSSIRPCNRTAHLHDSDERQPYTESLSFHLARSLALWGHEVLLVAPGEQAAWFALRQVCRVANIPADDLEWWLRKKSTFVFLMEASTHLARLPIHCVFPTDLSQEALEGLLEEGAMLHGIDAAVIDLGVLDSPDEGGCLSGDESCREVLRRRTDAVAARCGISTVGLFV